MSTIKMKILLSHKNTVADGSMGGFSTVYFNLAKNFTTLGHNVFVLTRHAVSYDSDINFISVKPRSNDPIEYSNVIAEKIRAIKPDIVECPTWSAECLEYAKALPTVPIVVRGDIPALEYGDLEAGTREKQMLELASSTIAVSKAMQDKIASNYNIKCQEVIYNGVDNNVFFPFSTRTVASSNPNRRRIIWVGRPSHIKGFDILLDIINKSPKDFAFDVVLGDAKNDLPYNQKNEYVQVNFHKKLSLANLVRLYNTADIILSTSRIEGFGLAVLEAMACGVPAVVPIFSGGLTEVVSHGNGGYFYNATDEAIDLIASTDTHQACLAAERAKQFSWDTCASKTINIYRLLL